jgi:hypothetical protein
VFVFCSYSNIGALIPLFATRILDVCRTISHNGTMKMHKVLKGRLYPRPEQAIFLNKRLAAAAFGIMLCAPLRIKTCTPLKEDRRALHIYRYEIPHAYKAALGLTKETDAFARPRARRTFEGGCAHSSQSLKGVCTITHGRDVSAVVEGFAREGRG